jgi:hypothetical protein
MNNLATQVQVPTDANLGSYFQKTKIAVGASPTAFPFKKSNIDICKQSKFILFSPWFV